MKITFEGASMFEIFDQLKHVLKFDPLVSARPPQDPAPVDKPVEKPVEKPVYTQVTKSVADKKPRTEKQLANDEKMRVAALARIAAKKAAKADISAGIVPPIRPTPEAAVSVAARARAEPVEKPVEEPFAEPEIDPAEAVKLRTRTMEELQEAYANGHHKEVLELLSRFGDGAKSFRELPPESFVPIRKAIDNGALT